ncbi:MAG: non-hydrolyzing UDP-N-acetylglucosamine 2-epimerase [Actinomycetota bacterium]
MGGCGPLTDVLCVFGTRPEAIKMAPVVAELQRRPEFTCRVCVTAQHRQMLDQVLDLFGIKPDFDLDVMRDAQRPQEVFARLLTGVGEVLSGDRPDWVLVQGDTTSTLATSLAAFHDRIPVGHVEAGLRTWDKWRPFPEEVNRRVVSIVADRHFAPTPLAVSNLLRGGLDSRTVLLTGNTVVDALIEVGARPLSVHQTRLLSEAQSGRKVVVVTAHRRESFGPALEEICRAVSRLADHYADEIRIMLPVHPNPEVASLVHKQLSGISNIALLPPLEYHTFVHLLKICYLILTDSGGIQEEAPTFGVPVLVLREVTERSEAIEAGVAKLVGTGADDIFREASSLLSDPQARSRMTVAGNPFGDGRASRRIADSLLEAEPEPFSGGRR